MKIEKEGKHTNIFNGGVYEISSFACINEPKTYNAVCSPLPEEVIFS